MIDSANDPIRVLVVDEHPITRAGIRWVLNRQQDMEFVAGTGCVHQALEMVQEHSPDVVTVELFLTSGHGWDLVQQLARQFPDVAALVVSLHDESVYAERMLDVGAKGFFHKTQDLQHLTEAIRTLAGGSVHFSPAVRDRVASRLTENLPKNRRVDSLLTMREMQVFELIGRGRSIPEIAEQLNLSRKTIETYRDRARTKMDLDTSNDLVCRAAKWVAETYGY